MVLCGWRIGVRVGENKGMLERGRYDDRVSGGVMRACSVRDAGAFGWRRRLLVSLSHGGDGFEVCVA
jgi:hypothetical protein